MGLKPDPKNTPLRDHSVIVQFRLPGAAEVSTVHSFTPREVRYLDLVRQGCRAKQIAQMLGVTPDVARRQVLRLAHGLGLPGAIELCAWAGDPAHEWLFAPTHKGGNKNSPGNPKKRLGILYPHPAGCRCGSRLCRRQQGDQAA